MNKAIAILAAAFVACTTTLNAQDAADTEGVRFGIKLAPNMGFVQSETKGIDGNGAGFGYTFGLLTEFPIGTSGNYRFATGLFLNNLTGKWKSNFTYQATPMRAPVKTKDWRPT
ncbi:MAG: hypothetical protein IPL52_08280 [Flavobacteriales bacterium]|nr:hypothetical protein [Flavobacteriales bacterium]